MSAGIETSWWDQLFGLNFVAIYAQSELLINLAEEAVQDKIIN